MKLIQRLLRKQNNGHKEIEYDNMMGFLTKEDKQKLWTATHKPRSPHRRSSYMKWICNSCKNVYFYAVIRCPTCESRQIEQQETKTLYELRQGSLEL